MIKYSLIESKSKGNKYYTVYFRIRTAEGKTKAKHLSTGYKVAKGNKRKAEERAAEIVREYEGLTYSDYTEMTLDQYMNDYLSRHKPMLKATTYDNYVSMYSRHIQPYFSKLGLTLKNIKPMHIMGYINAKMQEVSSNTVLKQYRLISQCMQDAVINDLIKKNPCNKVTPPKRGKAEHNWYDEQDLKELLRLAYNSPLEIPIFLAVLFGLRRSEIVGLKWSAIDWNERTLTICGSVTRAKQADGSIKDVYNDSLKTQASYSTYLLDDYSYSYLLDLYNRNMKIISNTNDYKTYLCVNAVGERLKLDYITHSFSRFLKKNNLKHIRFHDLRHSTISLLSRHFEMKQVQSFARHANYTMTADTYSHINSRDKLEETALITRVLGIDKYCETERKPIE